MRKVELPFTGATLYHPNGSVKPTDDSEHYNVTMTPIEVTREENSTSFGLSREAITHTSVSTAPTKPYNILALISLFQDYHEGSKFISMCEHFARTFPKGSIVRITIGDATQRYNLLREALSSTPSSLENTPCNSTGTSPGHSMSSSPNESYVNIGAELSKRMQPIQTYDGFKEDKAELEKLLLEAELGEHAEFSEETSQTNSQDKRTPRTRIRDKINEMAWHFLDEANQQGEDWLQCDDVKYGLNLLKEAGLVVVIDKLSNWTPSKDDQIQLSAFNEHMNDIVRYFRNDEWFRNQLLNGVDKFKYLVGSPRKRAAADVPGMNSPLYNEYTSKAYVWEEFAIFNAMLKLAQQQHTSTLDNGLVHSATNESGLKLDPVNDFRWDFNAYPFRDISLNPLGQAFWYLTKQLGIDQKMQYCRIVHQKIKPIKQHQASTTKGHKTTHIDETPPPSPHSTNRNTLLATSSTEQRRHTTPPIRRSKEEEPTKRRKSSGDMQDVVLEGQIQPLSPRTEFRIARHEEEARRLQQEKMRIQQELEEQNMILEIYRRREANKARLEEIEQRERASQQQQGHIPAANLAMAKYVAVGGGGPSKYGV